MPFGSSDPIDQRNRERIRNLEARVAALTVGLRNTIDALNRSTSLTQREKEVKLTEARRILDGKA